MESLFTDTTVLLTIEYVELFTSQQIASKLSKVRSLTGVQYSKATKTYALTGTWEQVNEAFELLQKWHESPSEEPGENGNIFVNNGSGASKMSPNEGISTQNTNGEAQQLLELTDKAEFLKEASFSGDSVKNENFEHAVEQLQREVEDITKKHKNRERRINRVNEIKNKPVKKSESTQKIKESKQKSSKSKKESKTVSKKKVLTEVKETQVGKETNIPNSLSLVSDEDHDDNYLGELSPSSSDIVIEPIENITEAQNSSKENKEINMGTKSSTMTETEEGKASKKATRKPGDSGYWSRVKIPDYNEKHKCTKCDVVLKSRKRYMEHLRRIHVKDFKCDVCQRRFGYPTDLHRHKCPGVPDPNNEKKKKGGRPKKAKVPVFLPCPECDYIGTSKKRFNGHVRRTHRLTFACDQCDKMFGFLRDLQRHKDNVHAEPSHFCDKCSRFYKSKAVFDEHIKTHEEGYIKPKYECQVCAKTFTTKYVLASHIKTEHLGMKKTYLCQICGKEFSQRNSYKQHSNAHAGIKPYGCDVCGKAFTYHKSLKEHKFMHDNIRRFQCQLCEKAFRQRTTLQIHMKVHKTIKDHICPSCGKGFSQKQALERHERIHTGVKPYTCVPCQRKFGDASTIRRHMLAIHQKNETNWREDIICSVKKKTDYYVLGGSGQNRTYNNKVKNNSVQSEKEKVKEQKAAVQETPVSEPSILLLNTQDQCSLDFKSEYSLSDLTALQEQANQLQTIQPGAIYAISTNVSQSQQLQNTVIPLPGNYNSSGPQVLDFSTLSQTASQPQLISSKTSELCGDQSHTHLDMQTSSAANTLPSMTLTPIAIATESQRLAHHMQNGNGLQTSAGDASSLGQTMNSIWGLVGYPAYYNTSNLPQYQPQQNQ